MGADGNAEEAVSAHDEDIDEVKKGADSDAASNQDAAAGNEKDDNSVAEDNGKDAATATSGDEGNMLRADALKKLIFKFAQNG